ncbi:MAG: HEAT repeat domain-containing protein [Planctomycetes bacterium]|nr:HEAT repeat domain-containing protein [Planctomycetota bacterium]
MRSCLLFVLVSVAVVGPGVQGTNAQPAPVNTLRFDLTLDKKTYEVGEPIVLTLRLTNPGNLPLKMPTSSEVTGRHDGYSFQVQNDKREALKDPCHEYIALMHSLGGSESVQPGDSYTRDLLLNYRVPPLEPGKYTVKGTLQPRGEGQKAQAESADVTFQIVATPPANLEKRVAQLAEDLRAGGDARRLAPQLGFTGHAGAATPLIDLLYAEAEGAQVAAAQALLYLDKDTVKKSLFDSLRTRGPRDRMIYHLVVRLQAKAEEVTPLLVRWLEDKDGATRHAAVYGLALSNVGKAPGPDLFPLLEVRLKDPLATVRHGAAAAVGAYQNAAALKALKAVVHDPDAGVSSQATTAVGWVAAAAKPDSAVRKEAIEVLRDVARSGGRPAEQATYWLGKIENK